MPRFQKWLIGVAPDAPADEVARSALTERLFAVVHFLDKSIGEADEAEAIHQLRVWTRRASAALKLFEPVIPHSRRKWMKRTLRKLRRTAGAVRDCDVHLQRLETGNADAPQRVVKALKRERQQARQQLKALRRRLQKDDRLPLHVEQLMAGIAWPKRLEEGKSSPSVAAVDKLDRALKAVEV